MIMSDTANTGMTLAQRRSNQIKLLILWLIPVLLMATAGITYYLVQAGKLELGSKNNGVLVRPLLQMTELFKEGAPGSIEGVEREAASLLQGKWTMIVRTKADCDQRCRDALYLSRQLHVRLNKDAYRVRRVYMYESESQLNAEFKAFLDQEHPLIATLPITSAIGDQLASKTTSTAGEPASFFLVDPQGWLMMYYLAHHDGNAVLADLKHLLKLSLIHI